VSGVTFEQKFVEYGAACRNCERELLITVHTYQHNGYVSVRCRCGKVCDLPRSFHNAGEGRLSQTQGPWWFVDDPDVTFEEVVR